MKQQRLDTQALIQTCRNNYQLSKVQQKIKQLQLLLQLRTKEKQMVSHQVRTLKQQYTIKQLYLQNQITQLKRQCADLRYSTVKNKRLQAEKAEKQIEALKKNYELAIMKERQQNMIICKELQIKHRQQINRLQQQYQRMIKYGNYQCDSYKSMFQNGTQSEFLIKKMEEDKNLLILGKKDLQAKNQMLKQILKQREQSYKKVIQENDQTFTALNGQILGLRLQEKMLRERFEEEKQRYTESCSSINRQSQQLKNMILKLEAQNQKYKKLLLFQNEQFLQKSTQNQQSQRPIIKNVMECNHSSLIKQLQRSLQLKTQQIQELHQIIQGWSSKIKFDQPLSTRLYQIQQKKNRALQSNRQILNILKPKPIKNNAKTMRLL